MLLTCERFPNTLGGCALQRLESSHKIEVIKLINSAIRRHKSNFISHNKYASAAAYGRHVGGQLSLKNRPISAYRRLIAPIILISRALRKQSAARFLRHQRNNTIKPRHNHSWAHTQKHNNTAYAQIT